MLNFVKDKRYNRMKSMYKLEKKKADLFEGKYIEERNKRIDLENHQLTKLDIKYLKSLIQLDETINGRMHGREGLFSEENKTLTDYLWELRGKLTKLDSSNK